MRNPAEVHPPAVGRRWHAGRRAVRRQRLRILHPKELGFFLSVVALVLALLASWFINVPYMAASLPPVYFPLFWPYVLLYFLFLEPVGKISWSQTLLALLTGVAYIFCWMNGVSSTSRIITHGDRHLHPRPTPAFGGDARLGSGHGRDHHEAEGVDAGGRPGGRGDGTGGGHPPGRSSPPSSWGASPCLPWRPFPA